MSGLDITPTIGVGRQVIQGYGDGGFRIGGERHHGSVLVQPDDTRSWSASSIADISVDSLAPLITGASGGRIVIIGCGAAFAMPPAGLADALGGQGCVLEWMDTGAACRTFNVLLIEDRDVVAALIAVS